MCWEISITDHKWYPATIREHACAEDENLCSLSSRYNSSRHSTQILDVQITMSFIRLLENPCTDESSNLSPSVLFGVVDPTGRGTRCMASMSRYPPSGPRWAVNLPAAADTPAVSVIEGCGCAETSPVRTSKTQSFMSCAELQSCTVNDPTAC